MQPPLPPSFPHSQRLSWMSLVTGIIGLGLVLLLMLYIRYALAHEYPQPGDLIIHFGWLLFPLTFFCGAVTLALGVAAMRRRNRPKAAATVGLVIGVMTILAVSLITWLFTYHS